METKTLIPTDIPVILASHSPRRRALLTEMGLSFTVTSPDADETYPPMMHPHEAVRFIAEKKARAVADKRAAEKRPGKAGGTDGQAGAAAATAGKAGGDKTGKSKNGKRNTGKNKTEKRGGGAHRGG